MEKKMYTNGGTGLGQFGLTGFALTTYNKLRIKEELREELTRELTEKITKELEEKLYKELYEKIYKELYEKIQKEICVHIKHDEWEKLDRMQIENNISYIL
jgi:hypothetical protein